MKTLVILFCDNRSKHIFDETFDGKSAFDLSLNWANSIPESKKVVLYHGNINFPSVFDQNDSEKVELEDFTVSALLKKLSILAEKTDSERVVFSYADLPFLNSNITEKLLETHEKYKAEYTFFDGLPYGFSPEIIDSGTLKILSSLSESNFSSAGEKEITRTSIFDFIKLDINSFEVEVETSGEDLWLLRLYFDAGTRLNHLSCKAFFSALEGKNPASLTEEEIVSISKNVSSVYKTVPSYYNIQISQKVNYKTVFEPLTDTSDGKIFIEKEKFSEILKKIADFSEEAVINLNFLGEPLCHPEFLQLSEDVLNYSDFTLLIETDGLCVTEELLQKLKQISDSKNCTNSFGLGRVIWIVRIDAFSSEMYKNLHDGFDGFEKAVNAVKMINEYFPSAVYPQFVRCVKNESELEGFWRYWSEKNNGSGGNVLIQKYSSFCKTLPDLKSADLSPLERNACYHLRRDFNIFADGTVPLCRETVKKHILGNIFDSDIEEIFKKSDEEFSCHLKNSYCEACSNCDEYYTFNF